MKTTQRIGLCLLALLVVFGGWYVADPLLATFQGADFRNEHARANMPLYRTIVYLTYVGAVWVTWLTTQPADTNIGDGL